MTLRAQLIPDSHIPTRDRIANSLFLSFDLLSFEVLTLSALQHHTTPRLLPPLLELRRKVWVSAGTRKGTNRFGTDMPALLTTLPSPVDAVLAHAQPGYPSTYSSAMVASTFSPTGAALP